MQQDQGRELDWNETIENDGDGFILLEPGEYTFAVKAFERGRFQGSAKLPPCNKAVLTIDILNEESGSHLTTITHNLFLHTKTEGLICQFFRSIAARKSGEKFKMNWNAVVGATGRCKVGVREWIGKDGQVYNSNQIEKFLDPQLTDSADSDDSDDIPF